MLRLRAVFFAGELRKFSEFGALATVPSSICYLLAVAFLGERETGPKTARAGDDYGERVARPAPKWANGHLMSQRSGIPDAIIGYETRLDPVSTGWGVSDGADIGY